MNQSGSGNISGRLRTARATRRTGLGEKRIAFARTEKGYVAFDDRCTHSGGSLAGGAMMCGTVQRLWHGSQFDVSTGKVKAGPARKKIDVYRVKEEDGEVRLVL